MSATTTTRKRANLRATSTDSTPACDLLPADQPPVDTHDSAVGGHPLDSDQIPDGTQCPIVAVDLLPADQCEHDLHDRNVGGHPLHPPVQLCVDTHARLAGWMELRIFADLFDRAQEERKAVANICRRPEEGGNVDPSLFAAHLDALERLEHEARLMLRRCYRRVVPPEIRAWQKSQVGIGEDSIARVLGHLGDPYIATRHYWQGTGAKRELMVEPPVARTVAQLWQYAGHGKPGKAPKGATAEQMFALGNPKVKMLLHLQAEWCMKQQGHYRDVYTATRDAVADKTHTVDCVRCGPSGKPALVGSPWAPGHQHAHALRIVGKTILRDLWLIRREALTGLPADHGSADTHGANVGGHHLDSDQVPPEIHCSHVAVELLDGAA